MNRRMPLPFAVQAIRSRRPGPEFRVTRPLPRADEGNRTPDPQIANGDQPLSGDREGDAVRGLHPVPRYRLTVEL
ncbi:hypothetical protein GCM10010517_25140 [Streptosporangium fragile]|uniref:Uncharacterized protein n=1 Tax=Streptosporangium fragile TaxID=46186 RepID=A0ABP6IBJ0_9ACTN